MRRFLPLVIFPLLGVALAWIFRPRALDPFTYRPEPPPSLERISLDLPNGHSIRFLGLPDPAGGTAFYLSEREVPARIRASVAEGEVTFDAALAFCQQLSEQTGRTLRLPTAAEWRFAARGGLPNANVAWGYGNEDPPKDLAFALDAPPSSPGPALGYGFRDLAGGRWEWTAEGFLLGGAWSERNPEVLLIDFQWLPPPGYGGGDTGLRLLMEVPVEAPGPGA